MSIKIEDFLALPLYQICNQLKVRGLSDYEFWRLLAFVSKKDRATLLMAARKSLSNDLLAQFLKLVNKRLDLQMPLGYIEGSVLFCDIELKVEPPLLIPRPETEEMCWWLIKKIQKEYKNKQLSLLDIGTGSGCIALAIAVHCPWVTIIAVDQSDRAIAVASENYAQLSQQHKMAPCAIKKSNFYETLGGIYFDIIVSNPPYLTLDEYRSIDQEVARWEDYNALVAEENGLFAYRKIFEGLALHKKPGSFVEVVLELGLQIDPFETLFKKYYPAVHSQLFLDMQGKKRWFWGVV